ncbi:transcription factor Adf-1-like [Diorhabda sublineata]|uniref:transcription factor Adf-1-like n=1 Tax=Diorhabda sublineata TaxID=1163346 RepID=UPI0024E0E4D5|nr:transcription factor Adf-1-like [Diorhabda sublineata]
MDFSKEECLTLIQIVRDNELLYNPSSAFYRCRQKREEIWNQISSEINKPAAICKKKWRHLRDHFLRGHLRRGNSVHSWTYYEPLRFLEILRPTRPPDGKAENGADDEDDVFSETEEVQSKRSKMDDTDKYVYEDHDDIGLIPVNVLTEDSCSTDDVNIGNVQNDRDTDMFMVEISNRIKRLPHQLQDIAKVNILAHITELELQNEQS